MNLFVKIKLIFSITLMESEKNEWLKSTRSRYAPVKKNTPWNTEWFNISFMLSLNLVVQESYNSLTFNERVCEREIKAIWNWTFAGRNKENITIVCIRCIQYTHHHRLSNTLEFKWKKNENTSLLNRFVRFLKMLTTSHIYH